MSVSAFWAISGTKDECLRAQQQFAEQSKSDDNVVSFKTEIKESKRAKRIARHAIDDFYTVFIEITYKRLPQG